MVEFDLFSFLIAFGSPFWKKKSPSINYSNKQGAQLPSEK
jgi:hypothetical protein